jgi:hypothetical protein
MITHEELTRALYAAYEEQTKKLNNYPCLGWDRLPKEVKICWSAVADAAWEHVEGENAVWAQASERRSEGMRELIVEFVSRAEVLIG